MFDEEIEEQWDDEGAVCPYCGYLNKPDGDNYALYSEETERWECEACRKVFDVDLMIQHSWFTRKIDE